MAKRKPNIGITDLDPTDDPANDVLTSEEQARRNADRGGDDMAGSVVIRDAAGNLVHVGENIGRAVLTPEEIAFRDNDEEPAPEDVVIATGELWDPAWGPLR